MIRSMTAFGNAKADLEQGTLALELRSVNSRFLDLYFRLPDELRHGNAARTADGATGARQGRDPRPSRAMPAPTCPVSTRPGSTLSEQLQAARRILPDIASPRLVELFNWPGQRGNDALDPQVWGAACLQAAQQALTQLQEGREREGQRLAAMMRECADGVGRIVETVESHLPLLAEHREKLAAKLRESVETAFPAASITSRAPSCPNGWPRKPICSRCASTWLKSCRDCARTWKNCATCWATAAASRRRARRTPAAPASGWISCSRK